jgi:peptidoglycan/LPS O-acetylase OafA/YrhL
MTLFVLVAGVLGVGLFVAGAQRPRLAVFVAAILWLLYAYYETLIANGTLCDANCNIRVDLVLFFPILGIATFCAFRAYERPPGPPTFAGMVLGAMLMIVVALLAGAFGYIAVAWAAGAVALAIGAYAVRARFMAKRA